MKTKSKFLPLLFILISSFSFAQERDTLNSLKKDSLIFIPKFTKETATKSIKSGNIILVLPGGIISAPTKDGDQAFCEKYQIKFTSQNCNRLPGEKFAEYNTEMFHYLDEKYGIGWRNEIRQDVIGLKID